LSPRSGRFGGQSTLGLLVNWPARPLATNPRPLVASAARPLFPSTARPLFISATRSLFTSAARMSDSEDESNIPDAATAQRLVKEFEGITNSDEAFAQFCLQESKWDLSRALNAFFAEKVDAKRKVEEQEVVPSQDADTSLSVDEGLRAGLLTTEPPATLTMVSWNIQGLEDNNLKKRTKAVCKILETEKADIVFLQEVVPETFSYIESKLSGYDCIAGQDGDYFVATLLRVGRVYRDNSSVTNYPGTRMGRHLLHVQAHCGQAKFDLLNTHLESTKEHAEERKVQLKHCLDHTARAPGDRTVVFGGDLNLRDSELVEVGGLPPGTGDCWQTCGSRKEVQFTWDMNRNTNIDFPGKWKPRCRFDRVYLKSSSQLPVNAGHFGLIGLQKIFGTASFPSDHWGLLVKLQLQHNNNKRIKMSS